MYTYADPRVCPSCREPLPQPVSPGHRCTTCGVDVGHPVAGEVFVALQRADVLVEQLRALAPEPVPVPPVAAPSAPSAPSYPAVPPLVVPQRTGVRTSSVPAILLSLGALCLLVAAVIFLAVAWSWLGVGGRTAVLAALTVAAAGGGLALHGRGLRLAGESIVTVALGLLVLDVLGAERAGWIGGADGLDDAGLALAAGLAVAVAGALLCVVRRDTGRLVVPQVAAVAGLFLAQAALPTYAGHDLLVAGAATVGFVALAAAARHGRGGRLGLVVTTWAALAAAALTWLDLALTGLVAVDDLEALTVGDLWTSAGGAGLLAAALLLLGPLAVHRDEALLQVCATASAAMTTGLVALPALDDGTTAIGITSLALGGLWTAATHAVPRARLAVAAVPATMSLVPVALVAVGLGGQALQSVLSPTGALRLDPVDPIASPALLVPAVAAVAALVHGLLRGLLPAIARRPHLADHVRLVLAAVLLAGTATLALQPVPLWTVVAVLATLAAAYVVEALRRDEQPATGQALGAVGVLLAAVVIAAPSTGLLLVPLVVLAAAAGAVLAVGRFPAAAELGGLLLPPALGGLTWVLADLAGLEGFRALPVLVVLAAAAMAVPRLELELATGLTAAVAALAAIPLASDTDVSLALHLTVAGALVVVHALVHPSRRPVAGVGTALLVLATWVRLADLGVHAPEPYTMPTALALVAFGLHRLRRDDDSSTALALLPGLVLATVPSLLQVLATDPASVRAALLGLGCLVLAVGGAQLRWSAPLLVGAAVGGLLVLVELAPYAGRTPQWVVIGLAGTTLVAVGVTWERRVVELQRAAHYVGRLR
jgi:hypothetical protein